MNSEELMTGSAYDRLYWVWATPTLNFSLFIFNFSFVLQLFCRVGSNKRINYFVKVAVKNGVNSVKSEVDSVVTYSALGVVISADSLTSVARADLCFSFACNGFVLLCHLRFKNL